MTDKQIDEVYDLISTLIISQAYHFIDKWIEQLLKVMPHLSVNMYLTVLTTTLPVKDLLRMRPEFLRLAIEITEARGENEEGLFKGL